MIFKTLDDIWNVGLLRTFFECWCCLGSSYLCFFFIHMTLWYILIPPQVEHVKNWSVQLELLWKKMTAKWSSLSSFHHFYGLHAVSMYPDNLNSMVLVSTWETAVPLLLITQQKIFCICFYEKKLQTER